MISFEAIANAKWGCDVLTKEGQVKHNTRLHSALSIFTCRFLGAHFTQKTADVQVGSTAVKERLLQAMKNRAQEIPQGQEITTLIPAGKEELYAKVEKNINALIAKTNKTLPADKKLAEACQINIQKMQEELIKQEELKQQVVVNPKEESAKEPPVEARLDSSSDIHSVAAAPAPAQPTVASILNPQSRSEEPAAVEAVKTRNKRRSAADLAIEEASRITGKKF